MTEVLFIYFWAWVACDADVFSAGRQGLKLWLVKRGKVGKKGRDLLICRPCIGFWISTPVAMLTTDKAEWVWRITELSAIHLVLTIIEGVVLTWQRYLSKK